jgi:alpha-glucosidase
MSASPWWRSAVVYQVYVRSFADTDGDGIGDLAGVRARLPHIRDLGVDAVWLNPFYPSPQADAGYDVADYRDVDPLFGTLDDFDELLDEAHRLGLRVINDLVPNHTSDEHEWFQAALRAGPGSRERARYLFRDGAGPDGSEPPNNWTSNFGGPAWTRIEEADGTPGQWYLHLFDSKQPDLDWTNDEVGDEFESVLRFWFDRGVDGFRIDVAHGLAKDPELPDLAGGHTVDTVVEGHPHWDLDEVHDVYRRWRAVADSYDGDRTFVGEVWVQTPERLARYLRPDELHTAFTFNVLEAPWDATALRAAIERTIAALDGVGAPAVWVLSNHDVTRHVTRYGGGAAGLRRARASTTMLLALPGGAYLYQGEELGLPEVTDLPDEVRQDPTFARTGGAEVGRDGCRVPIPWAGEKPSFGFSPTDEAWLPQPADWADLTAARQAEDPDSTLALYRRALRLRRERWRDASDHLTWLPAAEGVLAFRRGDAGPWCVTNTGSAPVPRPDGVPAGAEVLLASGPVAADGEVPGETTVWYG